MERKQGFFSALKGEIVRGLSPGKSRAKSPGPRSSSSMSSLLRRRKSHQMPQQDLLIERSGSLRPAELSPLKEGPDGNDDRDSKEGKWGNWMRGQLCRAPSAVSCSAQKQSDLRLLLGVLGAPLAPVHVSSKPLPNLAIKDTPIVSPNFSLSLAIFFFPLRSIYVSVFLYLVLIL